MANAPVKKNDSKPADKAADKAADKPADTFDFGAIKPVVAAALPKQDRKTEKPNPMVPIVKVSVDNEFKPMQYGPIPNTMVTTAKNLMHRAASHSLKVGLSIRVVDNGDETSTLIYQAKAEKKERKYTNEQVREWVRAEMANGKKFDGYADDKRMPANVFKAYREAHNL